MNAFVVVKLLSFRSAEAQEQTGRGWLYVHIGLNSNANWFLLRVHYAGLNVTRPEGEIGKYKSIPHHHRGEVQFLGR